MTDKSSIDPGAVLAALTRLGPQAETAIQSALYKEGLRIMAVSQGEVPVDTGNLRASGHVALPEVAGGKVSVQMGYGGSAGSQSGKVGYAVYVHEDMDAHHPTGKAKYLEDPMKAAESGFAGRIARDIKDFAK